MQILCSPEWCDRLHERVCVSAGVQPREDITGIDEKPIVPVQVWRPASAAELKPYVTSDATGVATSDYLGFLSLSATAREILSEMRQRLTGAEGEHVSVAAEIAQSRLMEHLYGAPVDQLKFLGLRISDPDSVGISLNARTGARLGLHVDSIDPASLKNRAMASNRLSINLGPESRYFLFVPETARDLLVKLVKARLSKSRAPSPEGETRTDLAKEYLRMFPETSVFRLEVRPGEAYVAPTDNIIHDACTPDTKGQDHTLVWLGQFHFGDFIVDSPSY